MEEGIAYIKFPKKLDLKKIKKYLSPDFTPVDGHTGTVENRYLHLIKMK